jgi:hypothetical protein
MYRLLQLQILYRVHPPRASGTVLVSRLALLLCYKLKDLQMARDIVRARPAVPICCRYLQRNSAMAVAFSVYQFSYRDALRTVGLHGAWLLALFKWQTTLIQSLKAPYILG